MIKRRWKALLWDKILSLTRPRAIIVCTLPGSISCETYGRTDHLPLSVVAVQWAHYKVLGTVRGLLLILSRRRGSNLWVTLACQAIFVAPTNSIFSRLVHHLDKCDHTFRSLSPLHSVCFPSATELLRRGRSRHNLLSQIYCDLSTMTESCWWTRGHLLFLGLMWLSLDQYQTHTQCSIFGLQKSRMRSYLQKLQSQSHWLQ